MTRDPFQSVTSQTIILPQENIDTDQIIPARFLTTTSQNGLGAAAFYDWRYGEDDTLRPDSPFQEQDRSSFQILVAGANFGCGSSREHAPWALMDFGFKAVISTKIADIFTGNSLKNGLLPIEVDEATHAYLIANPGIAITVDLDAQRLSTPNGGVDASFKVEAFARRCLLDGVDTLGYLLNHGDAIDAFEQQREGLPR